MYVILRQRDRVNKQKKSLERAFTSFCLGILIVADTVCAGIVVTEDHIAGLEATIVTILGIVVAQSDSGHNQATNSHGGATDNIGYLVPGALEQGRRATGGGC